MGQKQREKVSSLRSHSSEVEEDPCVMGQGEAVWALETSAEDTMARASDSALQPMD